MTRNRLILLATGLCAFVIFSSNSGGYTAAEVASDPINAGCSCHGAAVGSGSLQLFVKDQLGVAQTTYLAGSVYTVEVVLFSSIANNEAGMQSIALNTANQPIGQISNAIMPTQLGFDTADKFIYQNTDLVGPITVSGNQTTWQYTWIAPTINDGPARFFAIANDADGNGTQTGDNIFHTNTTLQFAAPASVDDLEATIQSIYPNPTNNDLNIDLNDNVSGAVNVHIMNLSGQCVKRVTENSTSISVDVSNLNSGNYIISIENKGKVANKQFIKF